MCSKELLLLACLFLLGGLRLTSTTTTTTFVAAMSIANQDLERYFRSANATQTLASMAEERIVMDIYNYAYLNYTYVHEGRLEKVTFEEEKARYGEGRIFTVYGKVVHMTDVGDKFDDTACTSNLMGTLGEPTPAEGVAWIALVRRGRCTFEEKVRNVHAKGASGVIIYNDKPVMSLEKMQIKGKERNITAVITYLEIGIDMARILDRGTDISAAIIQGRNGSRPVNTLNKTSVLFVSISFMVLMVISVVWLIFYYVQRFRYIQTKDLQSRQLCSVTKKAIMKIPTKTGKSTDEKDVDSDCCAICIEAYKPSDCIRVLPCKHEFHKNCIDPWLIEHRTCPMCKLDVLKFYGFVVGDKIHSTPSPQHIQALPPNVVSSTRALDNDNVPVIVVAVAPPFVATTATAATAVAATTTATALASSQQHGGGGGGACAGAGAGATPALSLLTTAAASADTATTLQSSTATTTTSSSSSSSSSSASPSPSPSSSIQMQNAHAQEENNNNNNNNSNSSCNSNSNSCNNSSNSTSSFSFENHCNNSNGINNSNSSSTSNSNSSSNSRPHENHCNCSHSNNVNNNNGNNSSDCSRGTSQPPLVLQVSTASRQVTDV